MDSPPSVRSRGRHLVAAAVVVAMWWIAFHGHDRLPLLEYVNFGIHELGHLVTYGFSDMVTALMGSIAQVAVPIALAAYFFVRRGDWAAAALCLAWAATSALEVAVYVADAPFEELELVGGQHDWAFILGPDGYNAIDKAGSVADAIRDGALITIALGFALSLAGLGRETGYEPSVAATSFATADSSAWAASATSGSAPRSASSPQYTPPS